ncbi:MAG: hypothetical protein J5776_00160 [Clostridiales bacterium]|nr:hypothetical protein [Clostridiales bacterium]
MKKAQAHKAQIRQEGADDSTQRISRVRKLPLAAWIAAGISGVMVIVLFVLFFMSAAGSDPDRVALFYNVDARTFPYVSMRYSLAQAGFDMVVLGSEDAKTEGESGRYIIPSKYSDDEVVIIAAGPDSFKVMSDINSSTAGNVLGYCLIMPEYPGNAALAGFDPGNPACDIAVFACDSKAGSVEGLSGSEMLFEKISGVDTVYGTPAVTGGAMSSKIFVSTAQNRYLSLAPYECNIRSLIYSSAFQSELAGYLGLTYTDTEGYTPANIWFILRMVCILVCLAALLMFLFFIPVSKPDKGDKFLKGRDSLAMIIFAGISLWLGLTVIFMSMIPAVAYYTRYLIIFAPCVLIVGMFFARIGFFLTNKIAYKRRKGEGLLKFLITALIEVLLVFASVLLFSDITERERTTTVWMFAVMVLLLDSATISMLATVDKKSRFAGEGPGSYLGNPIYFVETLVPAAAGLVMAFIGKDFTLLRISLAGIAVATLPYLAAQSIKRSSDHFELAGIVHGLIMALLVFTAF